MAIFNRFPHQPAVINDPLKPPSIFFVIDIIRDVCIFGRVPIDKSRDKELSPERVSLKNRTM